METTTSFGKKGVVVGHGATVEKGAVIGARTRIYPNAFIGARVQLGEECVIFPGAMLYEDTVAGDRVRIHANAVIGADGFGYAPIRQGEATVGHQKIYHLGRVRLGSDVEIGAGACIDRGTIDDTVVEDLVKIDNLVMIGHNCLIERGAVICGTTGLSGGVKVGPFAYLLGKVGVANKVKIGTGALVGAMTAVTKDIRPGEKVAGNPQRTFAKHLRINAMLNKMLKKEESQQPGRGQVRHEEAGGLDV